MKQKEMLKMLLDGASYKEIADAYGISRQCVQKTINQYVKKLAADKRGRKFELNNIKYQGIYDYFEENVNETLTSFAMKVYEVDREKGLKKSVTIKNLVTGNHNVHLTLPQIKKICEIVGKPFEEVFKERSDTE